MIHALKVSSIWLAVVIDACGQAPQHDPGPSRPRALQTGVASFYGREFAGRKTASGERFRLGAMTAASRTLPLGAKVKVTNLASGRSAHVRINDRGPYAKGRVIDLTPTAARQIGIDETNGVAPVGIMPVSLPTQATR